MGKPRSLAIQHNGGNVSGLITTSVSTFWKCYQIAWTVQDHKCAQMHVLATVSPCSHARTLCMCTANSQEYQGACVPWQVSLHPFWRPVWARDDDGCM